MADPPLQAVPVDPLATRPLGAFSAEDSFPVPSYGPQDKEMQPTISIRPRRRGEDTATTTPFKIEMVGNDLYVGFGAVTTEILTDGGTSTIPRFHEVRTMFSSGLGTYLKNDPYQPEGAVGTVALANSSVYGIWLVLKWQSDFVGNPYDQTDEEYTQLLVQWAKSTYCQVVASGAFTNPYGALPYEDEDNPDSFGIFLGQVTLDSGGASTVIQHRRSDIVIPSVFLPKAIVFP